MYLLNRMYVLYTSYCICILCEYMHSALVSREEGGGDSEGESFKRHNESPTQKITIV
jgi:hypothetical protein